MGGNVEKLRRWKAEALPLLALLDRCHDLLPPHAQAKLGESKPAAVEAYLLRLAKNQRRSMLLTADNHVHDVGPNGVCGANYHLDGTQPHSLHTHQVVLPDNGFPYTSAAVNEHGDGRHTHAAKPEEEE